MEKLFSEFKHSNASDWKNQLIKELKGEDYESLRWHNENGFVIEPFYTSEDLKQAYSPAFSHNDWAIAVNGKHADDKELNKQFLQNLSSGASAISMVIGNHSAETALKGIELDYIHSSFYLKLNELGPLLSYLKKNHNFSSLQTTLFCLELTSAENLENWYKEVAEFKDLKGIKAFGVDAQPYHNLDCDAQYEVAIIMSALVEYLEFFAGKKMPAADFVVKAGVSPDYFVQMAKLRAIRRLWNVIKKEYGIENGLHLIVESGLTRKSVSDSYTNLLRTTVEAMAAVAGGCNELIISEFDVLFPAGEKLAERMAINQQLILKDECYLDKMADVACGSYYVESITDAIATGALKTFKGFENKGGYFKCIADDVFVNEIAVQAKAKQEAFDSMKQLAIGVNKFRNEKEKIELGAENIQDIKLRGIQNPVLNFELKNFFQHHA